MYEISVSELFDFFVSTLHLLRTENLQLSDEDLLYMIGEQLEVDATTYLHSNTVNRLIENNLLPESIANSVEELRRKLLSLIEITNSANDFRYDQRWEEVRQAASSILIEINR